MDGTETTTIETREGHRYAVTRNAAGREIRCAACDGIGLPDGTVLERHTLSPPLNWAVGKTVAATDIYDNKVRFTFADGSRLTVVAFGYSDGESEIDYGWEPTE